MTSVDIPCGLVKFSVMLGILSVLHPVNVSYRPQFRSHSCCCCKYPDMPDDAHRNHSMRHE
jgi:hypothetical protein